MGRKKHDKRTNLQKAMEGNTNALKKGNTPNSSVDKLLKNNGIDLNVLAPKMENYDSPLKWNEDSMLYMIKKAEVMKTYTELAHTLGGKALEIQDEITRLSMMINLLEEKLLKQDINPLESKEYQSALKLKKEYLLEKSKLSLDTTKAAADYAFKKSKQGDGEDEDNMFTRVE